MEIESVRQASMLHILGRTCYSSTHLAVLGEITLSIHLVHSAFVQPSRQASRSHIEPVLMLLVTALVVSWRELTADAAFLAVFLTSPEGQLPQTASTRACEAPEGPKDARATRLVQVLNILVKLRHSKGGRLRQSIYRSSQ